MPALLVITLISCGSSATESPEEAHQQSLAEARKGFITRLIRQEGVKSEVEIPPKNLFSMVHYQSNIGKMAAYLSTIPNDDKLHPAMVWITGGFGNDIGDVWSKQEAANDQSAAVIREAGIIMMYPSQRGAHNNPGWDETCFGEIDDILAAAEFLSAQKGIDPHRIYLGGHSTGGTKVMLAAECSNRFRAVFALGPVGSPKDYGDEYLTFDTTNPEELRLREPIAWLKSLLSPVYVLEGDKGNIFSLRALKARAARDSVTNIHFYELPGKDHFTAIQPACRMIARQILQDDNGGAVKMDFKDAVKSIR